MSALNSKIEPLSLQDFCVADYFYSIPHKNDVDQIPGAGEIGGNWSKLVLNSIFWITQQTVYRHGYLPAPSSTRSTTTTGLRCPPAGATRGFPSSTLSRIPASRSSSCSRRRNCRKSPPTLRWRRRSRRRSGGGLSGSYSPVPVSARSTARGGWCCHLTPVRSSTCAARSSWPVADRASRYGSRSAGARTPVVKRTLSPPSPTASASKSPDTRFQEPQPTPDRIAHQPTTTLHRQ